MTDKEIDWNKIIKEAPSVLDLEGKRRLLLKNEAMKLKKDLGIEEFFESLRCQVLKDAEIIDGGTEGFDSLYLRTPTGCWVRTSLRSKIKIIVPEEVRSYRDSGRGDYAVANNEEHWMTYPGFSCLGWHSIDLSMYAGFQDINGFASTRRGRYDYLRDYKQLPKTGQVSACVSIYGEGRDCPPYYKNIFSEAFNRNEFSVQRVKENLVVSIGKYFASNPNLQEVTLHRRI